MFRVFFSLGLSLRRGLATAQRASTDDASSDATMHDATAYSRRHPPQCGVSVMHDAANHHDFDCEHHDDFLHHVQHLDLRHVLQADLQQVGHILSRSGTMCMTARVKISIIFLE